MGTTWTTEPRDSGFRPWACRVGPCSSAFFSLSFPWYTGAAPRLSPPLHRGPADGSLCAYPLATPCLPHLADGETGFSFHLPALCPQSRGLQQTGELRRGGAGLRAGHLHRPILQQGLRQDGVSAGGCRMAAAPRPAHSSSCCVVFPHQQPTFRHQPGSVRTPPELVQTPHVQDPATRDCPRFRCQSQLVGAGHLCFSPTSWKSGLSPAHPQV